VALFSSITAAAAAPYVPKKDLTAATLRKVFIPDLLIPILQYIDNEVTLQHVCKFAHRSLKSEVS